MKTAKYWIEKLNLLPHPEGGYYKEIHRSDESVLKENLPERFSGHRSFSTAIYFLLEGSQCSKFHRIKSDELWHYYDGSSATIYVIDKNGRLTEHKMGLNIEGGEQPVRIVKTGDWFGAKVNDSKSYILVGCTVSPGFHFDDFEMADRKSLIKEHPQHKSIIEKLT